MQRRKPCAHRCLRLILRVLPGSDIKARVSVHVDCGKQVFVLSELTSSRGAYLLLQAWRQARKLRTLDADWDEEKHPRDEKGKFTSGGADIEPFLSAKKVQASQSTILAIHEKTQSGKALHHIAAEHGMTVEQVKWVNKKIKDQVPQMVKVLGEKNPVKGTVVSSIKSSTVSMKPTGTGWQSKITDEVKPSVAASPHPEGYTWEKKTTGDTSKYAYFKEGEQVSAPFAKEDYKSAIPTMHHGLGPQKPEVSTLLPTGEHTPGWPISNDTTRMMGTKYPKQMEKQGHEWASKLTYGEKDAISHYTGSGYQGINAVLRGTSEATEPMKDSINRMNSALAKSPTPPPPELVWRGLSGNSKEFIKSLSSGDVVKMKGFQSTSISPNFAHNWGSGAVFEIKPSKGAYVQTISFHKSEYEYLLPHGAEYKVHGVSYVKLGGSSQKVKVIQLEQLHAY